MPLANVVPQNRFVALLAEDDSNDLLLIRRAVERLGIIERLVTVSSGEEAISYLSGGPQFRDERECPVPNLLLLDQFMPRWSGLDVLHWARRTPSFEAIPAVVLSLGLPPAQAATALSLKAAYCPKTAHLEELPAAVDRAVRLVDGKRGSPLWLPAVFENRSVPPHSPGLPARREEPKRIV